MSPSSHRSLRPTTLRLRRRASESGAAAVEFALVLPLLLLLVFGIVDFSRAYNARVALSGGAREGARVLALGTGDVEATTKGAAPTLPADEITVSADPPTCSGAAGTPAKVTASYQYSYITPISGLVDLFGGGALASPITITGIGVMRCGG